ncbi:MAG: AAA family ATPase [Pseudomonadota bacterium]|nr:AAA family ATPase [Pseudomonadota bacterium]
MLKRKRDGAASAELIVVAKDPGRFGGLASELDRDFGGGGWIGAEPQQVPDLLKRVVEAPPVTLVCVGPQDMDRLDTLLALLAHCAGRNAPALLVVDEIPPLAVHKLMRAGAADFLPTPLSDGSLMQNVMAARSSEGPPLDAAEPKGRDGLIYPVYGVAGGVGATTFAVNLAWEIAQESRKTGLRVCLLDLDFQYGSVATYLDMPRRDLVLDFLSDMSRSDAQGFNAALDERGGRLSVFTAPADALPLNIVSAEGMQKLLAMAADSHDVVIVDLPTALTEWTEAALNAAQRFWAVMEIDMRSAQNMLRFLRALQAEDLPFDKLDYVMNRVPGFGDFGAKGRVKKMAETLGIEYGVLLPDGGKAVVQACDHGSPLAEFASGNPLRKEIRKTAKAVLEEVQTSRVALA